MVHRSRCTDDNVEDPQVLSNYHSVQVLVLVSALVVVLAEAYLVAVVQGHTLVDKDAPFQQLLFLRLILLPYFSPWLKVCLARHHLY